MQQGTGSIRRVDNPYIRMQRKSSKRLSLKNSCTSKSFLFNPSGVL
ncbi:hypothetical protein LEP1GSC203_0851 [Leptospira terpstrae serovar Hualin str. LT 11-33 = ATCC 700639]|uniref:Uncharacterized protein n=1 Tax=Leptospira terpstrae serovar Hualin str. LT 11-33 = ATCC 700639 TaxID=1257025 RepID=N1VKF2_9LEPT|nr:hypothetical protein LEP1GSC203_0851 [Leptospira terpstrae serovar Hualin str. LT 11-33 = ATCC 700639]